eukprot:scaffold9325_cov16-Prasinocladus_malaysianus.AAC.1
MISICLSRFSLILDAPGCLNIILGAPCCFNIINGLIAASGEFSEHTTSPQRISAELAELACNNLDGSLLVSN